MGLGAVIYRDHRQAESAGDRAAIAAVTAWVTADNAHDLTAMRRAMTSTGRIVFLGEDGVQAGPFTGRDFDLYMQAMFDEGIHLQVLREPVVANGQQAWVLTHLTRDLDDEISHHLFQLVREDGRLKVDVVMVFYEPPGLYLQKQTSASSAACLTISCERLLTRKWRDG